MGIWFDRNSNTISLICEMKGTWDRSEIYRVGLSFCLNIHTFLCIVRGLLIWWLTELLRLWWSWNNTSQPGPAALELSPTQDPASCCPFSKKTSNSKCKVAEIQLAFVISSSVLQVAGLSLKWKGLVMFHKVKLAPNQVKVTTPEAGPASTG